MLNPSYGAVTICSSGCKLPLIRPLDELGTYTDRHAVRLRVTSTGEHFVRAGCMSFAVLTGKCSLLHRTFIYIRSAVGRVYFLEATDCSWDIVRIHDNIVSAPTKKNYNYAIIVFATFHTS